MTMSLRIYELRCPGCLNDLSGITSDKVFICGNCQKAFGAHNGKLTEEQLFFGASQHSLDKNDITIFLPFWRFHIAPTVLDPQQNNITATTAAATLDTIWIPAFYDVRPTVFGNVGMNLTLARIQPQLLPLSNNRIIQLPGVARRREDATLYVQPFVAGIVDRQKDISGLSINVRIGDAKLWGLPFGYDLQTTTLTDGLLGMQYPTAMVEYFEELAFAYGIGK
ncbi:MAG: hypothetical protein JXR76_17730 [Deltaproteobacteria bacterium]|nr:hypothetical protein [Deltaproteobacteria bacterium]